MSTITLPEPTFLEEDLILPVSHLSVSSMNLYERCPQAWKHRHVEKQSERPSGAMTLGSAAGAALAQHYGRQLESGQGLCTEALLDEFSDAWAGRLEREEVDFGEDPPGTLKDSGAEALRIYHTVLAPQVTPVAVEREFELSWPGVPFVLSGFIDLETDEGAVGDFKMTTKRISEDAAAAELQPTVYLAGRRAESNPAARFEHHAMIRTKQPKAEITATTRTERQLDLLTLRVFSIARSIHWRWINDCWQGTGPDAAWLCRRCSYAPDCNWSRS